MKKRILAILLVVILCTALVPAASAAGTITKLYPASDNITILVNSLPFLPATLLADYSDGTKGAEVPAYWAYAEPDNFDAPRTVALEGYAAGTDLAATLWIKVVNPTGTVSEILPIGEIVTTVGHAPVLPAYVLVDYSSGEKSVQRAITWAYIEPDNYDAARTFYVEGYIDGTYLFTTVAVKVVQPQKEIESILPVDDVKTTVGKAPVLPKTVLVKYKNHEGSFPVSVTWAYIESDNYDAPRTFAVQGFVEGTDLSTVIRVVVEKASADKITKVYPSWNVKTKVNVAPELPDKVWVKVEGKKRPVSMAVVWDKVAASSYAKTGTFTVSGTVEGTDLKASVKVTVYEAKTTTKTISKIFNIQKVKTTAGTAPVLPTHVTVTYKGSNSKVSVPVIWDSIAAEKYANPGSFTVKGVISGTDTTVKVEVKVEKAKSNNGNNNNKNENGNQNNGNQKGKGNGNGNGNSQ